MIELLNNAVLKMCSVISVIKHFASIYFIEERKFTNFIIFYVCL